MSQDIDNTADRLTAEKLQKESELRNVQNLLRDPKVTDKTGLAEREKTLIKEIGQLVNRLKEFYR